jgi:ribosomal-protein-alanine N-acetyltransferase
VIRPATTDDIGAIAELELTLFGADAWSAQQIAEELAGAGREVLVEAGETGLLGYVVTMLVGDVADLQRIGVRPQQQRQGLATALLAEALRGSRMLLEVAEANTAARALYAGAGFVEIDRRRRYYRDGSDALVLERVHDRPHGQH